MIAKEESQTASNEEFTNKLREEKEKMDHLLASSIELKEQLKLESEKQDLTLKNIAV